MNREAQILTALQGNITSEAKRALVDELNTIRSQASRRVAVAREVELGKEAASAHLTPAQPYVRHTTETDWLGKVASTRHTASEIHQMAKAEASRWFRQTSALARADVNELNIQAVGYAQVWSGQFGEALHVAQSSFLQAASHLAGVKLSADENDDPEEDQDDPEESYEEADDEDDTDDGGNPFADDSKKESSRRRTAADGATSFCRLCGKQLQQMENIWYALRTSPEQRSVGEHYCVPARILGRPGEFGSDGLLVPGTPGGEGGQYDAPAGTIFDAGGNPVKVARRRTASISMDDIQRWCDRNGCVMKDFPDELIEEVANSGDLEQLGSYLEDIEAAEIGQYNDDFRHTPDHDGFYGSRTAAWTNSGHKGIGGTAEIWVSDDPDVYAYISNGPTVQNPRATVYRDDGGVGMIVFTLPLPSRNISQNEISNLLNQEAKPEFVKSASLRTAGERCGATTQARIGNQTEMTVTCSKPAGHDGDHQGVTLDSDDNAIMYRFSSRRNPMDFAAAKSLGVDWFMPGKKRPFATSTRATSDLIVLLGEDGHTVQSAHDAILYDPEGKAILAAFIAEGYVNTPLIDLVGGGMVLDQVRKASLAKTAAHRFSSRRTAEADGIDSPSPDSQNGYAESTLPDVSVPSAPEDTNMGWIAEGDPNAVTGSMGVYEAMFMRSAADQVTSGPLYDAAGKDASLGVGHIWTNTSCPAYKSYDPKDCICSTKSASRTAAQEGWWPLVPDDRYPGENKLVCPACGSADVSISGNNLGRDIITNNLYTSLTCNSCGRRDILPEKPKDLRGASRKQAVGTSYYAIADDGPDNEMHEFAPGSADRTACGKHTEWCRAFPPSDAIYCPSCFGHEASRKHAEANGIDSPSPQSQNGYAETTLTDVSVGSAPDDTNLGWITDGDPNAEDEAAFEAPDNPIANEASINARFASLVTGSDKSWYGRPIPSTLAVGDRVAIDSLMGGAESGVVVKITDGSLASDDASLDTTPMALVRRTDGSETWISESWLSKKASRRTAAEVTRFPDGHSEWKCNRCKATVSRYRGEGDVTCDRCGAEYNAAGQQLRDDWRGNSSSWDEDVSDMDGFEIQHSNDDSDYSSQPGWNSAYGSINAHFASLVTAGKAYDKGVADGKIGDGIQYNPYPFDSSEGAEWIRGYRDAQGLQPGQKASSRKQAGENDRPAGAAPMVDQVTNDPEDDTDMFGGEWIHEGRRRQAMHPDDDPSQGPGYLNDAPNLLGDPPGMDPEDYEDTDMFAPEASRRTAGWDAWYSLQEGDPIRIGFEESASNGTFVRIEQNSNSGLYGDRPAVVYLDDAGRERRYLPTGSAETGNFESPRPARTAGLKTAMPAPADLGVSVGSIFYSSWGYDQTNVSFYEVVGLTPASVKVREVAKSFVSQNGPGGNKVIPQPGNYIGGEMTKRLQNSGYADAAITINSSETAWLWDGKPQYETDSAFGH